MRALLAFLAFAAVTALFALIIGTGPNDYTYFIRPSTIAWLSGASQLYDRAAPGFYFMPWSAWLFAPTVLFPPAIGQGMVNALNLAGIMLGIRVFGRGLTRATRALAAVPFSAFILLTTGNIDGIVLLLPAFLEAGRYLQGAIVFPYLASYLPALRAFYGFAIIHVDLIYPASLWVAANLALSREPSQAQEAASS